MAIYREVRTEVYCDICGEQIVAFKSAAIAGGVSRGWAAYFARQKGCTTGKKIICKSCRISRRIEKCSLQKKYGEAGKDGDGTCLGFGSGFGRQLDDEPNLTAGGIKDNAAGLAGELKEVEEVTELCGLRFNGYLAKIETPRPRGTLDEVIVAFTDAVTSKEEGEIAGLEIAIGSKVLVSGKVQTLKDFKSGKTLVFVLADFLAMVRNPMMQDDVALRGVIAHEPIYRTTPRGKRITDIIVIVRNELTGNKSFIPCICWQEQADEVAGWQQGDTVELLGRYQSRQYEKVIDTDSGSREHRTAYEVSVQLINRKERARNEK